MNMHSRAICIIERHPSHIEVRILCEADDTGILLAFFTHTRVCCEMLNHWISLRAHKSAFIEEEAAIWDTMLKPRKTRS